MQHRFKGLFVPAALLLLATVACQESPVAPSASLAPVAPSFSVDGNSDAAHACQQDGYLSLFRTDGTGFVNVGDCVSYAAQGGLFATLKTATFTHVSFSACNNLTYGYALDGVEHDVDSKAYFCGTQSSPDLTITYLSTQTLLVYLRDDFCGWTFYENGNHAIVTGSNPYQVNIFDGGGFCEHPPSMAVTGRLPGNLSLTKTIN